MSSAACSRLRARPLRTSSASSRARRATRPVPLALVESGERVLQEPVHLVVDRDVVGDRQLVELLEPSDGAVDGRGHRDALRAPDFFAADFFAADFLATGFLVAVFFAAVVLAAAFVATALFAGR